MSKRIDHDQLLRKAYKAAMGENLDLSDLEPGKFISAEKAYKMAMGLEVSQ